jgi:hypothetical protein
MHNLGLHLDWEPRFAFDRTTGAFLELNIVILGTETVMKHAYHVLKY